MPINAPLNTPLSKEDKQFERQIKRLSPESSSQEKFSLLSQMLNKYGKEVGTGHKRIIIPKEILTTSDLNQLGFMPSKIAIPEEGQTEFTSYRNPYNPFHLHSHGDLWTMHEDRHASSTMMAEKKIREGHRPFSAQVSSFISGLPHIITEGVPGLYYWVKGQLLGVEPMAKRILEEISPQFHRLMKTMKEEVAPSVSSFFSNAVKSVSQYGNKIKNKTIDYFTSEKTNNNARSVTNKSKISGRDDAYNTIEGLKHGGMAEQKRRELTPFGSGIRRIFGGMKNFMEASPRKVEKTLKNWLKINNIVVMPLPKGEIGIPKIGAIIPNDDFSRFIARSLAREEKNIILWGGISEVQKLDPVIKQGITKEGIKKHAEQIAPSIFAHEVSEVFHGITYSKKNDVFGSHFGPSVIVDEILYSMKTGGRKGFERMRNFRRFESQQIKEEFKKINEEFLESTNEEVNSYVSNMFKNANKYTARTEKIYATMEKNWLPKFETSLTPEGEKLSLKDKFKKLIGLRDVGLAGKDRSKYTDMGSGYQGTKRPVVSEYLSDLLVKGENAASLLSDKVFHSKVVQEGTKAASVAADLAWENFLTANHGSGIEAVAKTPVSGRLPSTNSHSPILKGLVKWGMMLGGGVFAWHLISGKDDDYNTIEGMSELGLASKQRKVMTDFGSGYDAMRAMAREMGVSFEHLIGTSGFQSALKRGTPLKKLGEGSFGVARLFKGSFRGQEFQFVRKTIKSEARELIAIHPEGYKYATSLDLGREASVLKQFGHTPSVPSFYGGTADVMYMEHIPGTNLREWSLRNPSNVLPEKARKDITETAYELAGEGVYHGDVAGRNVIFDPKTGRTGLIDWGQWTDDPHAFSKTMAHLEITPGWEFSRKMLPESINVVDVSINAVEKSLAKKKISSLSQGSLSVPAGPKAKKRVANKSLNKIQGHQDIGMSAKKSELSSDFRHGGSWKGLFGGVSKKITKYMAKGIREGAGLLLDPRKAAKLAEGKSLESFVKALGWEKGHVQIIRDAASREQMIKRLGMTEKEYMKSGGSFVLPLQDKTYALALDPEITRSAFKKRLGKKLTPEIEQALQSEDFMKTIAYHETLERQVMERFQNITPVPWVKHAGSQVLLGEAGFIKATGNQKLKDMFKLARRQTEERKAFEAGIEAFQEEGVSPVLRKLTTDFGSGYRGLLVSASKEVAGETVNRGLRQKMVRVAQEFKGAQEQIWESSIYGGKNHTRRRSSCFVRHFSSYARL